MAINEISPEVSGKTDYPEVETDVEDTGEPFRASGAAAVPLFEATMHCTSRPAPKSSSNRFKLCSRRLEPP